MAGGADRGLALRGQEAQRHDELALASGVIGVGAVAVLAGRVHELELAVAVEVVLTVHGGRAMGAPPVGVVAGQGEPGEVAARAVVVEGLRLEREVQGAQAGAGVADEAAEAGDVVVLPLAAAVVVDRLVGGADGANRG